MDPRSASRQPTPKLEAFPALLLTVAALAAFHLAFLFQNLWWLVFGYLGCLFELRRLPTARQAFYVGLVAGLGVFAPQMGFLWAIFKGAALPLWLVLALFHAAFLLSLNRIEVRWGTFASGLLAPIVWCGIEYLRSEVWWLRFAWFTAGECLPAPSAPLALHRLGIYGLGLAGVWIAGQAAVLLTATQPGHRVRATLGLAGGCLGCAGLALLPLRSHENPSGVGRDPAPTQVRVAGLQLEFPSVPDLLAGLDSLIRSHPEAELLMVSEYSLEEPPPKALKAWCQRHRKWLVVGGKQPIAPAAPTTAVLTIETTPGTDGGASARTGGGKPLSRPDSGAPKERFHNTAFVIDPRGQEVFQQVKSRPIQFFSDGEPASTQRVWDSPWGRLGIAICYDASYRQVMDELIRQGATGLLIPTMDVEHWGEHEHRLNARMATVRAAEYRVPVFRVASSGISQLIDTDGRETATAPFPGQGHLLAGTLTLAPQAGSVPLDAWLAPACTAITAIVILRLAIPGRRKDQPPNRTPRSEAADGPELPPESPVTD